MWAQLITTNLKPGHEGDLQKLVDQFHATEQKGSGLVRSMAMQDQKDPSRVYMLVVFESEEKAREKARITAAGRGNEARGRSWPRCSTARARVRRPHRCRRSGRFNALFEHNDRNDARVVAF